MKKKSILLTSLIIYIGIIIPIHSCEKDEEQSNTNPTCSIINPLNDEEVIQGETVTISVEAHDSEQTVEEVQFFIDDISKGIVTSAPYFFKWDTKKEQISEHTIRAKATNSIGKSNSDKIDISIVEPQAAPLAEFSALPLVGKYPLLVEFIDQSLNIPTAWLWDFGDGAVSDQQHPIHTYQNKGTYSVSLTVSNLLGDDVETKMNFIVVNSYDLGTYTDPRDNQIYNTVVIDNHEWFAENLNYDTINSWCYENNEEHCVEYGRLYPWEIACEVCPPGWHLPTYEEWYDLLEYHGGKSVAGGKLKEEGTEHWLSPNSGATNENGFSALPGGSRDYDGSFINKGAKSSFWTSSEFYVIFAWSEELYHDDIDVFSAFSGKIAGKSVRCIKDY